MTGCPVSGVCCYDHLCPFCPASLGVFSGRLRPSRRRGHCPPPPPRLLAQRPRHRPRCRGLSDGDGSGLHERLGQDIHIIDVRTPEEFAAGHIEGAQLLPLGELEGRMAELPKDGELYVVCRSGSRSAQASELLTQAGRSVTNVDGGMLAWEAAGLPVVQ
ncbi:rhodanese-like domain-containing protein [Deinococcus radiophilus]|uniref:rhodanese-like domain-containing protein n=1 Tax=Deinococcus radiophilus TaxID=32062 RepID=UPI003610845A